jgi:nucleotide-binding universal stress UspA family protein
MGAGEGAGLLLVGRRGRGAPLGFHLGGVARVLLTRAHCPVEIVPLHRPRSGAPTS